MKKNWILVGIAVCLMFSCGSMPTEFRGTQWDGSISTNGGAEQKTTVLLHPFGSAELLTFSSLNNLSGSWTVKGDQIIVNCAELDSGETFNSSVWGTKGSVGLIFMKTENGIQLVEGSGYDFAGDDSDSEQALKYKEHKREYLYTSSSDFSQTLYYQDLEETRWTSTIEFEPAKTGEYNYVIGNGAEDGVKMFVELRMVDKNTTEKSMWIRCYAMGGLWKNPEGGIYADGDLVFEPIKNSYWHQNISGDVVELDCQYLASINLPATINTIGAIEEQTTLTCSAADASFNISYLLPANEVGSLVVKEDVIFTKDTNYSSSITKF